MNTVKEISELLVSGYTEWSLLGHIYTRERDDLTLFAYTSDAYRSGVWNKYERVCRGLIISSITGEVVARPFDKFFNWLEGGRKASGYIVNVTEKIDGSLGILYRHKGNFCISTTGSFDSEQAIWATGFLRYHYDLWGLDERLTLLFEIVYPGNHNVVDYGQTQDLILLAIRDRFSGKYLSFFPDVVEYADEMGFTLPKTYQFNSIADILEATGQIEADQEGWVVEFSDGSRWKFKGDRYLELQQKQ